MGSPRGSRGGIRVAILLVLAAAATAFILRITAGGGPESTGAAGPGPGAAGDHQAGPPADDARQPAADSPAPIAAHGFGGADPGGTASDVPQAAPARFTGRTLDAATGAPLAGCRVEVFGSARNDREQEKHERLHGKVAWKDPGAFTTGADGRFEIAFAPPPPWQFALAVTAEGRVGRRDRWLSLDPGRAVELGDLRMRAGTRVRGRVVDDEGAPRPGVIITALWESAPRGDSLAEEDRAVAQSDAGGAFEVSGPMAPGMWRLSVRRLKLIAPECIQLAEGEAASTIEIRVAGIKVLGVITGIVVDDSGAPVSGAYMDFGPRGDGPREKPGVSKDGTFRLERRAGDPDAPVSISVWKEDHERFESPEPVPWGQTGVRIVLRRGLGVAIEVRRGDTGAPVEEYAVRCFPDPSVRGFQHSEEFQVRGREPHPGGRLELTGLRRGPQVLLVEPAPGHGLASALHRFEVSDTGAPLQVVLVHPKATRLCRVRRRDGSPVPWTNVQLLRPVCARPVDDDTRVIDSRQVSTPGEVDAWALMHGLTDENGTLELKGPPAEPLAVRATGPGYQPVTVNGIDLGSGSGAVELVVPTGATVSGRIGPAAFLDQAYAAVAEADSERAGHAKLHVPSVSLTRPGAAQRRYPPHDAPACLARDGSFEITGVPAGTWDLRVTIWKRATREIATGSNERVAAVENLEDGEVRRVDIDLTDQLEATLTGVVRLDGVPLAATRISIPGVRAAGDGTGAPGIVTDADGRFSTKIAPGRHRLLAQIRNGGQTAFLHDADVFDVRAAETLDRTFDLRACTLRLRALSSDGRTPVEGATFEIRLPEPSWPCSTRPTDAAGWVEQQMLAPAAVEIYTWPKHLLSREAQTLHLRTAKREDTLVLADRVTLSPPGISTTIVLPARAGY